MGIRVEEAVEADVPRLMEVQFSGFDQEPYHEAIFPGGNTPEAKAKAVERTINEWRSDPTQHLVKATDVDSGEIMAYAKWQLYEHERPESEWKKPIEIDWCDGRLKEIAGAFLGNTHALRHKTWQGRPYVLLALLVCHADWQRRGAGTALTQWGVDQAKRLGLPAYVEASVAGQPVYERCGFKPVDAVVIRKEECDREKDIVYVTLIHEGGSKSQSESAQNGVQS